MRLRLGSRPRVDAGRLLRSSRLVEMALERHAEAVAEATAAGVSDEVARAAIADLALIETHQRALRSEVARLRAGREAVA